MEEMTNLVKNEKIKEKVEYIENLIQEKKYKEAYFKLAAILEYLNIMLITKKLNTKIENSDIVEIAKIYNKKDETLFEQIVSVNGMYESLDINTVDINDVINLEMKIEYIYDYMLKTYGEFI